MTEAQATRELAGTAQSLFRRGYSFGTAGNISVRLHDRVLISPTNSSFEDLAEDAVSVTDMAGNLLNHCVPSKEAHFHLAFYSERPDVPAIVHLHSTYATAVSCLSAPDGVAPIPVFTPYFAMRIPVLPVVPYLRPGHPDLAEGVRAAARVSTAMLLKNHGPIARGQNTSRCILAGRRDRRAVKTVFPAERPG
jgi:3-dehydro-4-phosphotetronate decarboxylase